MQGSAFQAGAAVCEPSSYQNNKPAATLKPAGDARLGRAHIPFIRYHRTITTRRTSCAAVVYFPKRSGLLCYWILHRPPPATAQAAGAFNATRSDLHPEVNIPCTSAINSLSPPLVWTIGIQGLINCARGSSNSSGHGADTNKLCRSTGTAERRKE